MLWQMGFLRHWAQRIFLNEGSTTQESSASLMDILRGQFSIPSELLPSRARFRFLNSEAKLLSNMYIYNLSKKWGGYSAQKINSRKAT